MGVVIQFRGLLRNKGKIKRGEADRGVDGATIFENGQIFAVG